VQPLGELVTHQLQLPEAEHPRLGVDRHRLVEAAHRIGGHEGMGQVALESGDLGPERPPGRAFVRLDGALAQRPSRVMRAERLR
jgi:hypothetical protein